MNIAEEVIVNSTPTSAENSYCSVVAEKPQEFAENLKNLTSFTFMKVFPDEESAVNACCEIGLLPKRNCERIILCPKCGDNTRAHSSSDNRMHFIYRCYKRMKFQEKLKTENAALKGKEVRCYGYISPLSNTFFEGVSASTLQVLRLLYCWVIKIPVTSAAIEAQVSKRTAVDFYGFCREIAEIIISNSEYQIGGTGLHVEVDEKYTWKRKYSRRRNSKSDQLTIFGIYCKETKQGIFWRVEDNNRRVVWSQLLKYIAKDSIIMSNVAPHRKELENLGYKEYRVLNHNTPVKAMKIRKSSKVLKKNKNAVNRYIALTKRSLRSDRTLQQYMSEYTYRSRVLSTFKTHGQRYCQFLEDIKRIFPGPNAMGMSLKSIGISVETEIKEPYFDIEIKGHEKTIEEDIIQIQEPEVA